MSTRSADEHAFLQIMLDFSTELICFFLGVGIFRSFQYLVGKRNTSQSKASVKGSLIAAHPREIQSTTAPLQDWNRLKSAGLPLSLSQAKALGKALAGSHPDVFSEFLLYLKDHSAFIVMPSATVNSWLSALASAGRADLMEDLAGIVHKCFGTCLDIRGHELLLGAAAAMGQEAKVDELVTQFSAKFESLTVGASVQLAWGYVSAQKVVAAARWALFCSQKGAEVPPRLVLHLLRVAAKLGCAGIAETLDGLMDVVPLTSEGVSTLLRRCLDDEDVSTARRVERLAAKFGTNFTANSTEALLKLYARAGDASAIAFFKEAVSTGFIASQGLCGSVLSRCSESKHIDLVDAVGDYLKSQETTTLATFKTLMKAYACCGLFDRACDLYLHVEREGPEPDDVMRGCVMKFAILCGRVSLCCQVLSNGGPRDPSVLCSLIRVAGRHGDLTQIEVLWKQFQRDQLEKNLDTSVYNAAIETCLTSGNFEMASDIFERIKVSGQADGKSFASMVRGLCAQGHLTRAAKTLEEMEEAGFSAEGACYNTLVGAAVTAGDIRLAWDVFRRLEKQSASIDPYALSIMMKAARSMRSPAQAEPILALLDRVNIDMWRDNILLNTALDACIQHRDATRLAKILDIYNRCNMDVSVQTYGLLIKGGCTIGDTRRCKLWWREMTEEKRIQPNAMTLGCMIDALVTVQHVDEAVNLFSEWKKTVTVNTVIYSTLMKGFVSIGDAHGAMQLYHQLKRDGLQMNLVSYTTLIDSQARAGNMEVAADLFQEMRAHGCEPNTITYSALIKGHCIRGSMGEALKLFIDMMDRGLQADAVVFNTMLDGCVRHENFELADKLLAELPRMSIIPSNFTVSIITKMWGKRKDLDKAFHAVRTLARQHSLNLDAKNGTSLISACFANRAPLQAIQAFEDMRAWRHCSGYHGPDDSTYGTLISGLVRCKWFRKAASYAEKACSGTPAIIFKSGAASTPGTASLKLLFRELVQEGLDEELGRPVMKALAAAGEGCLVNSLQQAYRGSNSSPSSCSSRS